MSPQRGSFAEGIADREVDRGRCVSVYLRRASAPYAARINRVAADAVFGEPASSLRLARMPGAPRALGSSCSTNSY